MHIILAPVLVISALWLAPAQVSSDPPVVEKYLTEGKLVDGEKALADAVKASPTDSQARFELGTLQFLRAVEKLVQSFHRYGMRSNVLGGMLPFARLPIPPNGAPEPIRYTDLRALMQTWNEDLARAEATLAKLDDKEVKLPLHFGLIRLDMNGDGKADPDERLFRIYAQLTGAPPNQAPPQAAQGFRMTFDRADAAWLRGYCHLLMAMTEAYLAHDAQELFDDTAPMFFPKAETPFPFLRRGPEQRAQPFQIEDSLDAIALIHLLRLRVKEPARMKSALEHLEAMIVLSRESWKFILAETDDDHEWVPNPKQHSVLGNAAVTDDMVKGWMSFLDEAEALLKGQMLVPFWRQHDDRGLNLRRVFLEPRTFDLVLWVQGTAAAPFLEKGPRTKSETWQRFNQIFNGQFIGFAIWFN
jgi:hypothetical protein